MIIKVVLHQVWQGKANQAPRVTFIFLWCSRRGPGHHGDRKAALSSRAHPHSSSYIFYWLLFCSRQDPVSSHGPSWIPLASLHLHLFFHPYNHTLVTCPLSACETATLSCTFQGLALCLCANAMRLVRMNCHLSKVLVRRAGGSQ